MPSWTEKIESCPRILTNLDQSEKSFLIPNLEISLLLGIGEDTSI